MYLKRFKVRTRYKRKCGEINIKMSDWKSTNVRDYNSYSVSKCTWKESGLKISRDQTINLTNHLGPHNNQYSEDISYELISGMYNQFSHTILITRPETYENREAYKKRMCCHFVVNRRKDVHDQRNLDNNFQRSVSRQTEARGQISANNCVHQFLFSTHVLWNVSLLFSMPDLIIPIRSVFTRSVYHFLRNKSNLSKTD